MAERVTIAELGAGGDGVATIADERVFVPTTLPGEVVEIERRGNRARLTHVVEASPDRVAPVCRHFGTCGGCALQHMAGDAYRAWKRSVVVRSLALHGIDAPVEALVPIAPGTRRRAVFSAVAAAGGVVLGFNRRGSEEIVAITECPVLLPAIVARLGDLRAMVGVAVKPGKRARVVVVAADNGLDIAIDGGRRLDQASLSRLAGFAGDPAIARLTVDGTEIFRARRPEIATGSGALLPTPGGFLQAAAPAEKTLADLVLAHLAGVTLVADLFAGAGTFSLRLAVRAAVTAVEGDQALLDALGEAVRHGRGLKPVTLLKRDLFANPLSPIELDRFGGVVFDPPAAGARAQSAAIAASKVPKVVAVSCNPATLARDARILIDGGYRLTRVVPVDQFLYSAGIEAVAAFER